MKIQQSLLIDLLKALGVKSAQTWSLTILQRRINTRSGIRKFGSYVSAEVPDRVKKQILLNHLLDHQGSKRKIEIIPDTPKPRKKPGKSAYAHQLERWAKNPEPEPTKGRAADVIAELRRGGRQNPPEPVSKLYLMRILIQRYPDGIEKKMRTNLDNLVPGRCRKVYGLVVVRARAKDGQWGYCIPPVEGRK